tara:strand:+ start:101 stop:457 length:357 start_codon:yes stop_codon:yes gene_type:complete
LRQGDLEALKAYEWPGNIRELQNVIERALIGIRGGKLNFDIPSRSPAGDRPSPSEVRLLSYDEMAKLERSNVIAVLNHTRWKISGPSGAADLLGVNPATLTSRLKAMKIERPRSSDPQ